jgi:hypothetical protein
VAGRRAFVKFAVTRKISLSRACALVKVSRRRLGYVSRKKDDELIKRLKELTSGKGDITDYGQIEISDVPFPCPSFLRENFAGQGTFFAK